MNDKRVWVWIITVPSIIFKISVGVMFVIALLALGRLLWEALGWWSVVLELAVAWGCFATFLSIGDEPT